MNAQVVVLAAGQSSRFSPFNTGEKSLHVICGKPIISYTFASIQKAGFNQVIVVTNGQKSTQKFITQHAPKGLDIQFATLDKPQGQGAAILAAKPLIKGNFFVLNSQQFRFHLQIKPHLQNFSGDLIGAVLRKKTKTPEKYGILELDGDKVEKIVEKPMPANAPSNWKTIGTYFFTKDFLEILSSTKPHQYSLESAINEAASKNNFVSFKTDVAYSSLKYPWDLFQFKDLILEELEPKVSPTASIASTAIISDQAIIEAGAQVHDFAVIEGSAYLGSDSIVGRYCQLRNGSVLESGAKIERYCDARNSQIGPGTHIHSGFVGDSIIGAHCRIGAGFITANKRLDRQNVIASVKDQPTPTGKKNIGAFIGDSTQIGVRTSTMPGTIIGNNSNLGPGLTIKGTYKANSAITKSNV